MSIVDGTYLPEHLNAIKKKRPEERTPLEQAALDAYDKKYQNDGGAQKIIDIVDIETKIPPKNEEKVCRRTSKREECSEGSPGIKCRLCNPSGKM